MHDFFHDVILHSLEETLLLLPFLFLTYLLMEWIEQRASERTLSLLSRSGRFAPPVGALFGVVPQCGFSAMASNLYAAGFLTLGTLLSVLLSTSDEMLPLLLGGGVPPLTILAILGYKVVVATVVGLALDLILSLLYRRREDSMSPEEYDAPCSCDACQTDEQNGCACASCNGTSLVRSALLRTMHITLFLLLSITVINLLLFFIGEDTLRTILTGAPGLSHAVCALLGLIPNCAVSILLSELYLSGVLSAGAMLAGLLPGAGVGILILCRTIPSWKQKGFILGILVLVGIVFGLLADAPLLAPLFAL